MKSEAVEHCVHIGVQIQFQNSPLSVTKFQYDNTPMSIYCHFSRL